MSDENLYPIPFMVRSGFKVKMHIIFLFCNALFVVILFTSLPWILKILDSIILLFLLFCWIYIGILRKSYMVLDENEITIKSLLKIKKINWSDMAFINIYKMRNYDSIGIATENESRKLDITYIPMQNFASIDPTKLLATMNFMQQKFLKVIDNSYMENIYEPELEKSNYCFALIISIAICLIVGIIYGFTLYYLKINILFIPVFGLLPIYLIYLKEENLKKYRFLKHFIIGIICASQFFIGIIVLLVLSNSVYLSANGFINTVLMSVSVMVNSPGSFIRNYLYAAVVFLVVTMQGVIFKRKK